MFDNLVIKIVKGNGNSYPNSQKQAHEFFELILNKVGNGFWNKLCFEFLRYLEVDNLLGFSAQIHKLKTSEKNDKDNILNVIKEASGISDDNELENFILNIHSHLEERING